MFRRLDSGLDDGEWRLDRRFIDYTATRATHGSTYGLVFEESSGEAQELEQGGQVAIAVQRLFSNAHRLSHVLPTLDGGIDARDLEHRLRVVHGTYLAHDQSARRGRAR